MHSLSRVILLTTLCTFAVSVIGATYAVDGYNNSFGGDFFVIDKATGNVLTTTDLAYDRDVERVLGGQGLAVGPDGKLYMLAREARCCGSDSSTALVSIDVDTGSVQLVSWLDDDYYHSLTFGYDGTAYFRGGRNGDKSNQVLSFDFATQTLSMVSDAHGNLSNPGNLSFNPLDGKLYSFDNESGSASWLVWDLQSASEVRVEINSSISKINSDQFGYAMVWDTEESAFLVTAENDELWYITPTGEATRVCQDCGDEGWRGLASTGAAEQTFKDLETSIYYSPPPAPLVPVPTLPLFGLGILLSLLGLLGLSKLRQ